MKIPIIPKTFKLPIELYKKIEQSKGKMTFHGYVVNLLKNYHKNIKLK